MKRLVVVVAVVVVVASLVAPAASCGIPLGEIRSAAERGEMRQAVELARGELEGLRTAATGMLTRLATDAAARDDVLGELDAAPPAMQELLETWAAADSGVDETTRTFARARLCELDGGDWRAALAEARAAADPAVRAYALRGRLPGGVPADELLDVLSDPAPRVALVAARGLSGIGSSGLTAPQRADVRRSFAAHPEIAVRARLAGALDPEDADDRAALAGALGADVRVAVAAARVLGRLPHPTAVPGVSVLLAAPPCPAGLALAIEAGRHGAVEIRDAYLERVLGGAGVEDDLRAGALLGLADDEAARVRLRAAAERGPRRVRIAACERLLSADPADDGCVRVLRGLVTEGRPEVALTAAELLFEAGDSPAAGWLRSFAVHEDAAVRRRVMSVSAARRFDSVLLGMGLADPDPGVAAAAAVAALRVPDPLVRPGVAP